MKWFFVLGDDDVIELRARAEGSDGLIGDAIRELEEGDEFYGLSYETLRKAEAGIVEVDDEGRARLVDE